ncbi:MAG: hypothetical protein ACO3QC_09880, partial [Phycisphaerales bacterium]
MRNRTVLLATASPPCFTWLMSSNAVLKETTSRCPVCIAAVAARVERRADGATVMRKSCAAHGDFETILATDPARY